LAASLKDLRARRRAGQHQFHNEGYDSDSDDDDDDVEANWCDLRRDRGQSMTDIRV
jgi:hypothetical protein